MELFSRRTCESSSKASRWRESRWDRLMREGCPGFVEYAPRPPFLQVLIHSRPPYFSFFSLPWRAAGVRPSNSWRNASPDLSRGRTERVVGDRSLRQGGRRGKAKRSGEWNGAERFSGSASLRPSAQSGSHSPVEERRWRCRSVVLI